MADVDRLNIIHVAGTKGKTSTCRFVESILNKYRVSTNHPTKVGLYTSPHLKYVRDRYQIDGVPMSEELFTQYFFEVWQQVIDPMAAECELRPGYFTFLTLVFIHAFLQQGVTATVVETGVGGEYDCTNIVGEPIVTGITKIGIDHVRALRRDKEEDAKIEDIAWHKAGILKTGRPGFSVPQRPEVLEVFRQRAAEKSVSFSIIDVCDKLSLHSNSQRENASLAVALVDKFLTETTNSNSTGSGPIPEEVRCGIEQTYLLGRCHAFSQGTNWWFLDGAHNEDSLKVMTEWFAGISKTQYVILRCHDLT